MDQYEIRGRASRIVYLIIAGTVEKNIVEDALAGMEVTSADIAALKTALMGIANFNNTLAKEYRAMSQTFKESEASEEK